MAIHGGIANFLLATLKLIMSFLFQDARLLFENLKALKQEITNRAQGSDSKQQLEAEEAWDGLVRDLQFEDDPAKENSQTALEGGNIQGKQSPNMLNAVMSVD